MRRIVLMITASVLTLGLAATPALARHRSHHHHRSHLRHASVRRERFGTSDTQQANATSDPSSPTAGTVTSFTNGVLTITLGSGSTVSGMVTDRTEIECSAPEQGDNNAGDGNDDNGNNGNDVSMRHADQGPGGGDNSNGNDGGSNNGDQGDQGDENGNQGGQSACTTAALAATTVVQEAELSLSGNGATWTKIELVTQ